MRGAAGPVRNRKGRAKTSHDIFADGGEMGALMRTIEWSKNPVGPVEDWPQSLKTALSILLRQRTAVFIFWGPEYVQFYNDAYRPILGTRKHPAAMGQRGSECWKEIWDIIHPMLESVYRGNSTAVEDGLLVLDRDGYLEEGYYTYTYSPIIDEGGNVGGAFCVVYDTTERVIGERRLRTLSELAARSSAAKSAEEACRAAAETLAADTRDIPFSALYLYDGARREARLAGTSGIPPGTAMSPPLLRFDRGTESVVAAAAATGRVQVLENLGKLMGALPGGVWPVGSDSAIVLPTMLPGQAQPAGFLLAGISPRKRLDHSYRTFFELVSGQIATAVADARAYDEERKRAEGLAELDRAKTTFFSNISHEFRTPLTLMLGPVEDLLEAAETSAEVRGQLDVVRRNGLRLLKLVNTLLDFARIEAGRVQADYQPTDLATLTADVASVFRSAIENAGLRLTIDCALLPERVFVDRDIGRRSS
jgi:signal transduction histidine kinase